MILSELTPEGFSVLQKPRKHRGGGLALIHKDHISCCHKPISTDFHFTHFEHLECTVASSNNHVRLCVIYRPPASKSNGFKTTVFFKEWSCYLDKLVILPEELIITGDLNFHVDDPNNTDARRFRIILDEHGLTQHVKGATHVHGHTLDLIITGNSSHILRSVPTIQDPALCDNKTATLEMTILP